MTSIVESEVAIDLYSAASFAHGHPHEQYTWLRENAPVYSHPAPDGGSFWAVTQHDDIRTVERNPKIYSSAPTVLIEETVAIRNFLSMDDPEHGQYRRMLVPRLMPKNIRHRMPALEEIARSVIDEVCETGECDLVEDVAGLMAGYTAADFLGISRSDGRLLHDLIMVIHSSPDVQGADRMIGAVVELMEMGKSAYHNKLKSPSDDVLSMYAHAEFDGIPISEEDFVGNFILLTDGSLDTSRNLISGGMHILFNDAKQRQEICEDFDGLLPSAIEEMLRCLSPVTYIRRVAVEDTCLHGQDIAAGDRVAVYFGSGNRDSAVFVDPDTFDIRRSPNDHIAFGAGGPHFCVGSHLGRAEGSVMLRELLMRLPDIEQSSQETWAATSLTSGLATLPARFTPTKRSEQQ
jgi:cytochrome P450